MTDIPENGNDDLLAIPEFLDRTKGVSAAGTVADEASMFAPLAPQEKSGSETTRQDAVEWRVITPVPADAPSPDFHDRRNGSPSHIFAYRDSTGRALFHVRRFEGGPKALPLAYCEAPDGTRQWRAKLPPAPRPLYNLDKLAARSNAAVLFVEGEKTADAAGQLFPDHVVVTTAGGALAAHLADFTPLAGRTVRLWPDHDPIGEEYAQNAKHLCEAVGARCGIVQVPTTFPEKWDLADEPPPGFPVERLRAMVLAALPPETCPTPAGLPLAQAANGTSPHAPHTDAADSDAEIDRLARLSELDYERTRKEHAERLGIRPGILDKLVKDRRRTNGGERREAHGQGQPLELPTPEPYGEPVDGAQMLDEISRAISRHLALPESAADAMTLWTVFAHAIDAFSCSPRLLFQSPEKRCGKSTALVIVSSLVPRPLIAANITPSALFRAVEVAAPTLIVDEGDTFIANSDELGGVLNSGHTRPLAYVIRNVGDDHEPRKFTTWCALAIAAIGSLPDTLEDRSIAIPMRRRRHDEKVERLRSDRTGHLAVLASKIARWVIDNEIALGASDPETPGDLNDRAADNWRPLIAIADRAGGGWPQRTRRAAILLSGSGTDDADSNRAKLLADIRSIFVDLDAEWLPTTALLGKLVVREDRPWSDYRNGKALNANGLATLLRPYGIRPKVARDGTATLRGYHQEDFADAFCRYLGDAPATPKHSCENNAVKRADTETSGCTVSPADSANSLNTKGSYGVAAQSDSSSPTSRPETEQRWRARV